MVSFNLNQIKCSFLIFSANPSKNNILFSKIKAPWQANSIYRSFLEQNLNKISAFISRLSINILGVTIDKNLIKILSYTSWKLSKKTLSGIYNALIGSVIDFSFFNLSRVSRTNRTKTNISKFINTSSKSIYYLTFDIPFIWFFSLLKDQKIEKSKLDLGIN